MKARNLLILMGVVLLLAAGASAQTIVGTAHDLKGAGYGSDQVCIFCHTPHNAKTPQLVPLWNHNPTTQTFTLYSSGTLNAVPGQPTGASKACLSCHDGTIGVDSYGSHAGVPTLMAGAALLGTDLSNDHPVSFTYDAALATADGGLKTPFSASSVDNPSTVPLFSAKVECASCHNAHNDTNTKFLRISNAASALCLKCHNK